MLVNVPISYCMLFTQGQQTLMETLASFGFSEVPFSSVILLTGIAGIIREKELQFGEFSQRPPIS